MPVQVGFSYPPDTFPASSQPSFSTSAASAYPGLQPSATPVDPLVANWQPGLYSYATNNSRAYSSQQSTPGSCVAGFVSHSPALQHAPQSGFDGYSWTHPGDGNVTLGANLASASLPSPAIQNFETLSVTQGGAFSDSDPAMYGEAEVEDWEQQQQHQINQGGAIEPESPRNKRAKKSSHQRSSSSLSNPANNSASKAGANTGASMSNSKGKHRSASASKNPPYRPDESPEGRRSRNSHNLVEKQYRNRLNMQFENLMNTLPEAIRSPTGAGGGFGAGANTSGGDSDGQGQWGSSGSPAHLGAFEAGERRLSKAQVLDYSARYIRSLESDNEKLTADKDSLTAEKQALMEALQKVREKRGRREEGEGEEGEEGEGG
ncbi:allergen Fus c 3 [Staphylotrichum tortipilum]|uniref:Allergen Fus c 3 n=1 Tax=Staphylotrichum tortipilum TaxID=2831512 RepID=A0AAN6RY06_9PEZI|nr:allergen Fus c 3 [Staphylotrichum longicolle]